MSNDHLLPPEEERYTGETGPDDVPVNGKVAFGLAPRDAVRIREDAPAEPVRCPNCARALDPALIADLREADEGELPTPDQLREELIRAMRGALSRLKKQVRGKDSIKASKELRNMSAELRSLIEEGGATSSLERRLQTVTDERDLAQREAAQLRQRVTALEAELEKILGC